MNNWLADNAALIYMVLGTTAVILGYGWWQTKRGWLFIGSGVTVLLIGLIFLLRTLLPSDAEQITRVIQSMSAAVKAHDVDRLFAPLSDSFTFRGKDRAHFRSTAELIMRNRDVTDVQVWGFDSEGVSRTERIARVSFNVKPHGNWGEGAFYLCRSEWVLENDGKWRLRTFEIFNPFVEQSQPMAIPGF
jgi:hypothetical protein